MIKSIYTRTFNILKTVPIKLWGISLLNSLLSFIAIIFGFLPIIFIPINSALSAGMIAVYYSVYNGKEADTKTLLSVFRDFKTFKHTAGGMCWLSLWICLWFLIPIAGPFIAIYKSLSYAFTPYILNEEKTVSATDALKKSMQDTKGYKLNMFAAIFVPSIAFSVITAILSLLSMIPFVGIVFTVINLIISLVYGLFSPMFFGLIEAGFYEYGKKPVRVLTSAPQAKPSQTAEQNVQSVEQNVQTSEDDAKNICPVCGKENSADKKFCMKCGAKL